MNLCSIWSARPVQTTARTLNVRVVDDNEPTGSAMTAALTQETVHARYAGGGVEAIDMTRDWVPDVIVLDINMPVHDGFSTARVLRRLHSTRAAVIIAFTALDEREVRMRGEKAGFDGYCQKGRSPDHLIAMISGMRSSVH